MDKQTETNTTNRSYKRLLKGFFIRKVTSDKKNKITEASKQ